MGLPVDSDLWQSLEGSQAETAAWISHASFILDQTIKKTAWNMRPGGSSAYCSLFVRAEQGI